jgi:hypothetical protein
MWANDGNKAGLISYLTNEGEVFLESRMGETSSRFCEGGHSNLKSKNTAGGAGIDKYIYYETNIFLILVRLRGK